MIAMPTLHLATFRADVTPPAGHPHCGGWIEPVRGVDDPLEALGVILLGMGRPVILLVVSLSILAVASSARADGPATPFKAGVATKVITPGEPLWMAGYGNRTKPAEGKQHDLKVKALALEDASGGVLV